MTRYLLDTNVISELMRNPQGNAAKRIAKAGEDRICTSIIVAAELRYGCAKRGSKRLLKAVEDLLAELDVLPFDIPSDAEYGAIRAELETAGRFDVGGKGLVEGGHEPLPGEAQGGEKAGTTMTLRVDATVVGVNQRDLVALGTAALRAFFARRFRVFALFGVSLPSSAILLTRPTP